MINHAIESLLACFVLKLNVKSIAQYQNAIEVLDVYTTHLVLHVNSI